MFGLSVLLVASSWIGIFGYLRPDFTAITAAYSGLGLFISSVALYGVWDYFERGIRALKYELYIDISETAEERRHFVHELSNLVKARENGRKHIRNEPVPQAGISREAPATAPERLSAPEQKAP